MMVNLMRANQRWMMIIISVLVIISFVWFYSDRSQFDHGVSDRAGKLYGRTVSRSELERMQRQLYTGRELGTYDLYRAATADGYDPNDGPVNFLVLRHKADELGIAPSDEEVVNAIKGLPAFKGADGEYDSAKYADFVDNRLGPRGFSENQLEDLVRMNLKVAKLREIVTSPVMVSPVEVRTRYEEINAKTTASVVRLKSADIPAVAEPTDEEISKYYEGQKNQFKQPERRKVQYVRLGLDEAQTKLQGKEKMDALKPLADQAVQFLEKLLDQKGKQDFAATASASRLTVKETAEFEQEQTTGSEELNIPQFAQSAFKLTKESPDSDVPLQTPEAFYVLHLNGITPERPLTLEEAKPKVVSAIKAERTQSALTARAEEVRTKLAEALKAGRSFAEAAKEAGVTAEEVLPFSLAEGNAQNADVAQVAQGLATGELSKFTPAKEGGFLVYVRGRQGVEDKAFDIARTGFAAQMQSQKSQLFFFEWLRASRDEAKPEFDVRFDG